MKILAFNFLRLGDVLMTCPLLDQIRRQNPNAEIHYLAYEEFKVAAQILPQVDRWHFISRDVLKRSLESLDHGLLDPADLLNETIDNLNSENFDQAYCLSHTLAGSYFLSILEASKKFGAFFSDRSLMYSSQGFRAFDQATDDVKNSFHYLDWYRQGLEFEGCPVTWNFDAHSRDTRSRKAIRKIAIQPLSADEKKGWTVENWVDFAKLTRAVHPDVEVTFLCAPSEEAELRPLLRNVGEVSGVALQEALEVIRGSDIFITVDTSTKHLANGTSTPVVELCFGSSNFKKQGVYKENSWIIVPNDSCHPCSMESLCPKASRTCTKDIKATELLHFVFAENKNQKFFRSAKIYRTKIVAGYWRCEEIYEGCENGREVIRNETSERHPET